MATALALEAASHHVYADHPERPARLQVLRGVIDRLPVLRLPARVATAPEVLRVHTQRFLDELDQVCRAGDAIIDMAPTYVTRSSFHDALAAAGGALACTDAVMDGAANNAFAVVRPPGHHAEPDHAMGFCLFNNVAIAARQALQRGLHKVAIVDFDAHHGNGTQAAFLGDEQVGYFSTHQWGIYPGSGWYEEAPNARRRIVNMPLPAGAGDQAFERIAGELLDAFVDRFKPEMLFVSAGYDAHWTDPLTSLGLSTHGFHALSLHLFKLAEQYCAGRLVFVLEGGYAPENVANGITAAISALAGTQFRDPHDEYPEHEPDIREHLEKVVSWHEY
jgi:acetoin utilization deacetylase AcuC-like enzyme